jgi:hypothetical protein
MKRISLRATAIFAALAAVSVSLQPASAQILVSAGSPYTQNFDSLASPSVPPADTNWTDNSTIPGWYASRASGGPAIATYRVGTGADNAGALYSFGVAGVNPITDRALGSASSGTPGTIAYGVRFQNDTTLAITNINISYTGEQWRQGGNVNTQALSFSYLMSNNPIISSDAAGANAWIPFTSLNFNTPTVGTNGTTGTAWALDGNASTNRQIFPATLLSNVVVFPGQEIFFRWSDINDSGNDHAMAVDDLTISFTTVPAIVTSPTIPLSGQPQSHTNNAGTRATFTVTATGSPLNYQWRLNGVDLTDGVKFPGSISGSTTPSLSLSNVMASDSGSYSVFVFNSGGSVTSSVAVLTVIDPAVNTQPASRTNIAGDTANFFVGAAGTGTPLSYQWRLNGTDLPGANASSLNVPNVQAGNVGSYSVVVSNNDFTVNYTTSSVATLTLLSTPAIELARWDFDATNSLAVTAPTASTGTGTASLLNGTTATFSSGTFSDPAGAPGADNSGWNTTSYAPLATSNKTSGVQFNVSTLGYQDVLLVWEQKHSPTASKYTRLQYTADGSSFVDADLITMTSISGDWVFYTSNLSALPGVNNNPNFAFRIVSEWEATAIGSNNSNYVGTASSYSTSGTVRFDLMTVFGNTYHAPTLASATISNIIGTTLTYGGGAGSQFVLVKSANVAAPLSSWTRMGTNFATPGAFSIPKGSEAAAFYRIKSE